MTKDRLDDQEITDCMTEFARAAETNGLWQLLIKSRFFLSRLEGKSIAESFSDSCQKVMDLSERLLIGLGENLDNETESEVQE